MAGTETRERARDDKEAELTCELGGNWKENDRIIYNEEGGSPVSAFRKAESL